MKITANHVVAVRGLLFLFVAIFFVGCSSESTAYHFFSDLTWWEWIIFILLIALIIIFMLALAGVEFAVAVIYWLLYALLQLFIWIMEAVIWIFTRLIVPLIRFLLESVLKLTRYLSGLITKLLEGSPLLAHWKAISHHAEYYIFVCILGGAYKIIDWVTDLFGDDNKPPLPQIMLECGATKTLGQYQISYEETEYDLPFGKSGSEVSADAVRIAEDQARRLMKEHLEREAARVTCPDDCPPQVTYSINLLSTPTPVMVPGTLSYAYTATATAVGSVTITCGSS